MDLHFALSSNRLQTTDCYPIRIRTIRQCRLQTTVKILISKNQRTTEAINTIFAADFPKAPQTFRQAVLGGVAGEGAEVRGRREEAYEDEEGGFDREVISGGECLIGEGFDYAWTVMSYFFPLTLAPGQLTLVFL